MGSWRTDPDWDVRDMLKASRHEWLAAVPAHYREVLFVKYGLVDHAGAFGLQVRDRILTYASLIPELTVRFDRPEGSVTSQGVRHWVEKGLQCWMSQLHIALGGEYRDLAASLLQTEALGLYTCANLKDLEFSEK